MSTQTILESRVNQTRRKRSHAIKKTFIAFAFVAVVAAFYFAGTSINTLLPGLLATKGYSEAAAYITTTVSAGLITGLSALFAGILERSRRERKGPVWTPYGIRGTANSRKCKSYSILKDN